MGFSLALSLSLARAMVPLRTTVSARSISVPLRVSACCELAAKALAAQLQQAGSGGEVFSYPGVGHAFMNVNPDAPEVREGVTALTGFPPRNEAVQALAAERAQHEKANHCFSKLIILI